MTCLHIAVCTVETLFTVYVCTVEPMFTVYKVTLVEPIFTVHYDSAAPKLCLCVCEGGFTMHLGNHIN